MHLREKARCCVVGGSGAQAGTLRKRALLAGSWFNDPRARLGSLMRANPDRFPPSPLYEWDALEPLQRKRAHDQVFLREERGEPQPVLRPIAFVERVAHHFEDDDVVALHAAALIAE